VGFIDPKKDEEDEALPGASGLHLDLDLKRCPSCRRELTPWQERCADCGELGVAASAVPADRFALPDLSHLDDESDDPADAADPDAS
jgi:rRNA maturation protein Nop10